MLTREQKRKISLLQQAIWQLQQASTSIAEALGTNDGDQRYTQSIAETIAEIEEDIEGGWGNPTVL